MPPDLCPTCNYDLSGLSLRRGNVCPECGGRVDRSAFQLQEEKYYRRKIQVFWLAALAPWLGPGIVLVGQVGEPLATLFGDVGVVIALCGPVASVILLYVAFRCDHRQEAEHRSRWRDVTVSVLHVALYTFCLWVLIGVGTMAVTTLFKKH